MTTRESLSEHDDSLLLLNAYSDGELDAAASLAFERRLTADARLLSEFDRLTAVRAAIAAGLRKEVASPALRDRIIASLPAQSRQPTPAVVPLGWRQMAASVVIACGLSSGATYLAVRPDTQQLAMANIVAGHQRALLAASPVDIASSDHHTVKPWFDTHLALSPPIPDLAASGFPLAGGRIDIVNGKAVPTMVYQHRQHLISLTAMPGSTSGAYTAMPVRKTRDGYTVLTWADHDFTYAAVSDIAESDLIDFQARWRAAAQAP